MPSNSLEDYGIYLRSEANLKSLADCPSQLKDLFVLILSVQSLQWDRFGGTLEEDRSIQATPVMQYQSELKLEAEELAGSCADFKRHDDLEEKWVQIQQPIVFYRFNREAEESYTRNRHHHCFICGKHFPLPSRPLLYSRSKRLFKSKIRGVHGDDEDVEDADVCRVHLNIPNFDTVKFRYPNYEDEKIKIPDLTIGLLTSSKEAWHSPPHMKDGELEMILKHDLVWPFQQNILKKLEEEKQIEPLFAFSKSRRVSRSPVAFPFAIWEAKKASKGDPVAQNALKVKMVLEWQQRLAERAKIAWIPLMFHFVSAGSEWKVYACHDQPSKIKPKTTCQFRLLWSGNCANETQALQLLYLVDIIALWGQFQYKPFAGACIRILRRNIRGQSSELPRTINFLEHQKLINVTNFRSIRLHELRTIDSTKSTLQLQRTETDTDVVNQLAQRVQLLSLETYYIPERDGFIWLLHRELHGSDLLVIRVNKAGWMLPALLIFNASNWRSPDFKRVTSEERARMPQNIEIDFRYDQNGNSFLHKCFNATDGHCAGPEMQFCAIVPLKRKGKQTEKPEDSTNAQNYFRPLERLLGIQTLVDAAQNANKIWCICQEVEDPGRGDHWILCDSTRCKVGWHHKQCVGLDEDYTALDWICCACKSSEKVLISRYDNKKTFAEGILAASDARIQRARSLGRAWKNHNRPAPSSVQRLINRKIYPNIEVETRPQNFHTTVPRLELEKHTSSTRCWAVLKDDPLRCTRIKRRFRDTGDP